METKPYTERIREAAGAVAGRVLVKPSVAAVLGSGLGAADLGIEGAVAIPYSWIPHMPGVGVQGHRGELVVGTIAGKGVAILAGRVHLYEGHGVNEVAFGVRVMAALGASIFFVTNAAGSTRADVGPGSLVVIRDHINMTGEDPTRGSEVQTLGPMFTSLTGAYDPALTGILLQAGQHEGIALRQGVYMASKGPCYETPAEVRMARTLGADLVGMSTVPEVIAARHCGMRVVGVSCVTNLAAGVQGSSPDHEEVKRVAGQASQDLARLFRRFVESLP